jgi:UDP-N-acetylglucosamine--N-acetylmuramyl-(pentapeptide) pyrophosphoryl-undecaprenol N-acetylglucosamine transferase
MLLVPLCGSGTRGDQVDNAQYFTENGAAITMVHPTPEQVLDELIKLSGDEARLEQMSACAKKICACNAAKKIAEEIATRVASAGSGGYA